MSPDENVQVVRRMITEAFEGGNFAVIDELAEGPSAAEAREVVTMLRTAFPNVRATIDDMVAQDDKVAYRGHFSGTHTGPLNQPMGSIPATGKHAEWEAMIFHHMHNGKIAHTWAQVDVLGLMQQLGAMPGAGGQ